MTNYPFQLIDAKDPSPLKNRDILLLRPFAEVDDAFSSRARDFEPGPDLTGAMNTALALGQPLLITGEPGTGKTQAAYYAAWKLGIEPVLHFQVKSDTTARDLLYFFDTVRYFHDAHITNIKTPEIQTSSILPNKAAYVEKRLLWEAMKSETPRVLLIDEIDKAPRDFPNDLLHELNQMEFMVRETQEIVKAPRAKRPIVFITSNSERGLPEPFLRRCVYHNIRCTPELIASAVKSRKKDFKGLSEKFIETAIARFWDLRGSDLRKRPATGELLVWLTVLALSSLNSAEALTHDLSRLPHLGVLLKDQQDIESLRTGRR